MYVCSLRIDNGSTEAESDLCIIVANSLVYIKSQTQKLLVLSLIMDFEDAYFVLLNAKNLAPPFLSIFSGTKSMISKLNVL